MTANETVELSFRADNPALVYVHNGTTDLLTSSQLGIYTTGNALQLKQELQAPSYWYSAVGLLLSP